MLIWNDLRKELDRLQAENVELHRQLATRNVRLRSLLDGTYRSKVQSHSQSAEDPASMSGESHMSEEMSEVKSEFLEDDDIARRLLIAKKTQEFFEALRTESRKPAYGVKPMVDNLLLRAQEAGIFIP